MSTPTAQTASQIIADALLALNVIRAGQTPSAEQQAQGIRRLNQMMALLEGEGKNLGYVPVGTPTAVLNVPDAAIIGIMANLAISWATHFGASVSAELAVTAERGMAVIEKITSQEIPITTDLQPAADSPGRFNIWSD